MIRAGDVEPKLLVGKPRASGDDPPVQRTNLAGLEVNPARAGMIPRDLHHATPQARKPRASGDDPRLGQEGTSTTL